MEDSIWEILHVHINVEKLHTLYNGNRKGVYGKMDMNGLGGVGMPYGVSTAGQLPVGFGMPLAMNDAAMKG